MIKNVYLFHEKGSNANGVVLSLELLLERDNHNLVYHRVALPHSFDTVAASVSYEWLQGYAETMEKDSLVIGVGLGGLLAAKLQQERPDLALTVFAISSPTKDDTFGLIPYKEPNLYALYSSFDPSIESSNNWTPFTDNNFDVMWMRSPDLGKKKYSIARIISAFLSDSNVREAVENIFSSDLSEAAQ
jgi:hypothetical protein